jgi:hypothetical protein
MGEVMASAKEINDKARSRALLALKYRRDGMTYAMIGEFLGGVSAVRARQIVQKGARILNREQEGAMGNVRTTQN